MKANEIKALLAKYYDGMTTEAEEERLARLLGSGDVPDELQADKDFFMLLHGNTALRSQPENIEARVGELIDGLARHDAACAGEHRRQRRFTLSQLRPIVGIAASVALLALFGTYLQTRNEVGKADKEALAQAQSALVMFSQKLNIGFDRMQMVQTKMAETNEKINKCVTIKLRNEQ